MKFHGGHEISHEILGEVKGNVNQTSNFFGGEHASIYPQAFKTPLCALKLGVTLDILLWELSCRSFIGFVLLK